MLTITYVLCALTSLACAVLLLRRWRATRVRLLWWCGLCFVGLAAHNFLLLVDAEILGDVDLSGWRLLPALAGICALLRGMIWEAR